MKYRKLRIAWSVTWGVVAVLLCVLWVRSYWQEDFLFLKSLPAQWRFQFSSSEGELKLLAHGESFESSGLSWQSNSIEFSAKHDLAWAIQGGASIDPDAERMFYFCRLFKPAGFVAQVPHWSLALLVAALSGAPWISHSLRFSVRTLLIATTLIAVVLGVVSYLLLHRQLPDPSFPPDSGIF